MAEKQTSQKPTPTEKINYLVIGHVTADLTDSGPALGGTVTFSGLTAQAMGLKAGIVTAFQADLDVSSLGSIWVKNRGSLETTTFKNISDGVHRVQYLYEKAAPITPDDIPAFTPPPDIVHLGPVANEVSPEILAQFPNSLKCLTPQGWFRDTDTDNRVIPQSWDLSEYTLGLADVAVISVEDVQYDEETISKMASEIPIFVVTENYRGARVYWHNDARYIKAPKVEFVDDTGAGDIFATAFFYRFWSTRDPWEAGRFAVQIASASVSRSRLKSIPTPAEVERVKTEIIDF
jgi:sugar/nucleoside kinase (ribokinase family)